MTTSADPTLLVATCSMSAMSALVRPKVVRSRSRKARAAASGSEPRPVARSPFVVGVIVATDPKRFQLMLPVPVAPRAVVERLSAAAALRCAFDGAALPELRLSTSGR